MSFLKSDSRKAIDELKKELREELRVDIYNDVAKKMIAETESKQKQINDELVKRLENWDIMLQEEVKKKVKEEWELINQTKQS